MDNKLLRYIRGPLILVALLIAVRYAFPSKMTFFWEVSTFGIYIIANDILYGYMGMVSFGQPFYLGIGAYAAALYLAHIGHNIFIAISLAILAGLVTGLILGPAYIRLRCADQRGDMCYGVVYGGKGPVSDYQW
jgi:branched-chain amino acid transport system permease protein